MVKRCNTLGVDVSNDPLFVQFLTDFVNRPEGLPSLEWARMFPQISESPVLMPRTEINTQ